MDPYKDQSREQLIADNIDLRDQLKNKVDKPKKAPMEITSKNAVMWVLLCLALVAELIVYGVFYDIMPQSMRVLEASLWQLLLLVVLL